jgi:hypothetical protein
MKKRIPGITALAAAMTLLSLAGGPVAAADNAPLTPEYAAKKENFRKQKEQQITPEKKKAAAENLKAERLKVYNAKQAKQGQQSDKNAKPEKSDKN